MSEQSAAFPEALKFQDVQVTAEPPKRRRATVLTEVEGRLVFAATRSGKILLPGGGIEPGETAMSAAVRELNEETELTAQVMIHLFEERTPLNDHQVFWAVCEGTPRAGDDAARLLFDADLDPELAGKLSPATQQIVKRYRKIKAKNQGLFELLQQRSRASD